MGAPIEARLPFTSPELWITPAERSAPDLFSARRANAHFAMRWLPNCQLRSFNAESAVGRHRTARTFANRLDSAPGSKAYPSTRWCCRRPWGERGILRAVERFLAGDDQGSYATPGGGAGLVLWHEVCIEGQPASDVNGVTRELLVLPWPWIVRRCPGL